MKKILLVFVLVGLLLTGVSTNSGSNNVTVSAASNATFTDISGHWAAPSIEVAVKAGILNGYTDGTFKPNNPITRAELLKVIALTFDLEVGTSGSPWYAPYLTALTKAGIYMANDYPGNFSNPATRNELAKLAVRAADKSYRSKKLTAEELMFRAIHAGIMSRVGTKAETFEPAGTTTRAQAAVVVTRLLKLKNGGTLVIDKGASTAAEVAWHRHNMITMFGQNDLVTFPFKTKINANYDVTIDQMLVLDGTDKTGYFAEYLEGMKYILDGEVVDASKGYLFAYKLIATNKVATNIEVSIADSFYMFTEGESGDAYLAKKYNYFDGLVAERKGLFKNRYTMSFAKKNSIGHNYYFVFVDKEFVHAQIKKYGAFPVHLERFGGPMSKSTQIFLTEVRDIYAL